MSDAPDPVQAFRSMADKIATNIDNGFGGAFVIVAPDGAAHDLLVLDNAQNPAIFWSLVKTRAEIALAEAEAEQRNGQAGFGQGYRR
jgi:hypothetical protein